jgi:flagellin
MSISVVTNLASLNSQMQLDRSSMGLEKAIARLTSGLRINSAADDAAGLAIANRHHLDNTALQVGIRAANDAISKLQIEDGAMSNITALLDRALTLAAQSASDTFMGDRNTLNTEFQAVLKEIDRTAQAAGLDQASGGSLKSRDVFVGNTQTNTSKAVTYVTLSLASGDAVDSSGLSLSSEDITTASGGATAIADIQTAVKTLGTTQGKVGAAMTRLQFAISQAQTMSVSVAASESRIRDANMAEEAANLTKFNILNQSGLAALAQANQAPAAVLALLR